MRFYLGTHQPGWLANARFVPAARIAERFGVSVRTVQRTLQRQAALDGSPR